MCIPALPTVAQSLPEQFDSYGLDTYGCGGATHLGAEVLYRVTLESEGLLVASAEGASQVAILRSMDALDCVDAHPSNAAARLVPGTYFVAVEGTPEASFSLRMALTTNASLEAAGVPAALAADALTIFSNAWAWGATRRTEYTVVDFTQHSSAERQWVFDLATGELLWNLRVAHGRNSTDGVDLANARTFSNEPGSNQSSLGLQRAAGTYTGTFGPSYRLEGLEPGFNDNVCRRDIVMHPWAPMGDDYVDRCGWARPSLGCPAIDNTLSMPVRDRLARPDGAGREMGTLMLFWYPGTDWHRGSVYLHGTAPTPELTAQLGTECDSSQDGTPMPPASGDYGCD